MQKVEHWWLRLLRTYVTRERKSPLVKQKRVAIRSEKDLDVDKDYRWVMFDSAIPLYQDDRFHILVRYSSFPFDYYESSFSSLPDTRISYDEQVIMKEKKDAEKPLSASREFTIVNTFFGFNHRNVPFDCFSLELGKERTLSKGYIGYLVAKEHFEYKERESRQRILKIIATFGPEQAAYYDALMNRVVGTPVEKEESDWTDF